MMNGRGGFAWAGLGSGLLFNCIGNLGLGLVVEVLAEPDVVADGRRVEPLKPLRDAEER